MLKRRLLAAVVGLALLLAAIGSTGIVADSLGQPMTNPAYACPNSGSSGGGC